MAQDSVHAPPGATIGAGRHSAAVDLGAVIVVTVTAFFLAIQFELSERITGWALRHEAWQVDELPGTLVVLFAGLLWFSWRRTRQAQEEVRERMAAQTLDLPRWEAGQRLMQSASPDAFANIAAGDRIVTANRVVLEACRKHANRAHEAVRCNVNVEADKKRDDGVTTRK